MSEFGFLSSLLGNVGARLRYRQFASTELFVPPRELLDRGGQVWALLVAGGGGGSGGGMVWTTDMWGENPNWYPQAGYFCGGAGEVRHGLITLPGPVLITIGAGGAGGPSPATTNAQRIGSNGGNSSIGQLLEALGGRYDGTSGAGYGSAGGNGARAGPGLLGFGRGAQGGAPSGGAGGPAFVSIGYGGLVPPRRMPGDGGGSGSSGYGQPGQAGEAGYCLLVWIE